MKPNHLLAAKSKTSATEVKPNSVLYVEDDENDALLLQLAYKQTNLPYSLKIVSNGQEAVDYLAGNGSFGDREINPLPCLILLDLNLPIKTGFEVLRWIREQEQFNMLPVIIYTASPQDRDRELATSLGANDYYVKPATTGKIAIVLQQIRDSWLAPRPDSDKPAWGIF